MRLTTFSDYSLRVLIYLGVNEGQRSTVEQIARAYGISRNHLMKVVHYLSQAHYIETTRGKGGGMRLGRAPEKINIGALVRATEENHKLVECFDRNASECRIEPACVLRGVLGRALEAFFRALDQYTLADLLASRPRLARLLVLEDRRAGRRPLESENALK
ncbi:MAG: Rrf2 family transcriptional regulator [Betaproteobacteria bacterium]|nr:Rrf2 family transcriptional regulator [Betaproteobacteria bacterium]